MVSPELYAEIFAWLDAGVTFACLLAGGAALAGVLSRAATTWDRHSRQLGRSRRARR